MSRKSGFCFTWNNYNTETEVYLQTELDYTYLVYGHEVAPTTGTPHLQGYIYWKNAKTISAARKLLTGADVRVCFGTVEQNYEYATKGALGIVERGIRPLTHNEKGKAGSEVYANALALALEGNFNDINPGVLVRCYPTLRRIHEDLGPSPSVPVIELLRGWQSSLLSEVLSSPDRRKIIWYVDPVGGAGKTEMAIKLKVDHGAVILDNGKTCDIAHALPRVPRIIIFDFARTSVEVINYQVIEKIKDGCVFSGKYNSKPKIFPKPHVVVFANFKPNLAALSADRWDIRTLSEAPSVA